MEDRKLENGRYRSWGYEVAFSKEDHNTVGNQSMRALATAEANIENMDHEEIKKELFDELEGYGFTPKQRNAMKVESIEFQEFDSPRWHGSGYFYYIVSAPTEQEAIEWEKQLETAINY